MRQGASWLGFATAGALTRTAIHFFPSAGGTSAPYAAHCAISIFGNGVASKSMSLEGGRLNQPDGLWLEDAFPELRSAHGLVGVRVSLHTPQQRVDMTSSGCVIEFQSAHGITRYQPFMTETKMDGSKSKGLGTLLRDGYWRTSIVFVNEKEAQLSPIVRCSRLDNEGRSTTATLSVNTISQLSVSEITLPEGFYQDVHPTECSFGLLRLAGIELDLSVFDAQTAAFLVYRDVGNGEIVSVSVL